ncbi:MAG: hypothetical protein Q8O14_10085 [bacterium]|jgi:hypothetical protein|nr:hypothetical protein [bacterium]
MSLCPIAGRPVPLLLLAGLLLAGAAAATPFRRAPLPAAPLDSLRIEAAPPALPRPAGLVSPGGAFLRSLVVPGWGQAAVARHRPELRGKGRTGFWLDLGLVAGAWGLNRLSGIKASEYRAYARRQAGAGDHGRGSDYWVDVSNHQSRADFNRAMLENGLPQRRYLDPADGWSWPQEADLLRYRDLRAVSEHASSQALAVGGAIFVNHVLSGVGALRLARQELELAAYPVEGGLGLALSLDLTPRLR